MHEVSCNKRRDVDHAKKIHVNGKLYVHLSARHSTASMSESLRMSSTYVLTTASTDASGR